MLPIKFVYGILGLIALYYVVNKNYKASNVFKSSDIIICLIVLFTIHYLLYYLNINLNPSNSNIENFEDNKCQKILNGKNIYGCFYEDEENNRGTCYWNLPEGKECPDTLVEYLKQTDSEYEEVNKPNLDEDKKAELEAKIIAEAEAKAAQLKEEEEKELAAAEATARASSELDVALDAKKEAVEKAQMASEAAEESAKEAKIAADAAAEAAANAADVMENGKCNFDILLYILPKLNEEQIKEILSGSIEKITLHNQDYKTENIKKCIEDNQNTKMELINHIVAENFQNQEDEQMTEYKNNFKTFKEKCAILQGALNISNNEVTKTLLKEVLEEVRCTFECTNIKDELEDIQNTIDNTSKFKEINQNYFDSFKTSMEKKCDKEIKMKEIELKKNSKKLKKIIDKNNPRVINNEIEEERQPRIVNRNKSINDVSVNFKSRSDFIDSAQKYVCNKDKEQIQAYRILGDNVNQLEWWNNSTDDNSTDNN